MSNLVVAIALAGGIWIFIGFVVLFFFAFVFGFYTRKGSAISQRPYRRPGAPSESPSELAHDTTQELRNWSRGTQWQHRDRRRADTAGLPEPVARALSEWRRASRIPRSLDPPVGAGEHTRGRDDVPTVTVYLDVSSDASRSTYRILSGFVEKQEIRLAVRQLPLADVHPTSLRAAEALEAAASQGRFFELLDRLSATRVTDDAELIELACGAVPEPERLRDEVSSGHHQAAVIRQIRDATSSGVHSVPEIFIGGAHYDGPVWRDELERTLRRLAESS